MRLTRRTPPAPLLVEIRDAALPAGSPIEQDFARLYERAFPLAVAQARWYLAPEAAKDAVQDAAAELFEKWDQTPVERKTVAYFLLSVHFRVVDAVRSEQLHDATFAPLADVEELETAYPDLSSPSPLKVAEQRADYEYAMRFVQTLPSRLKQVWLLSHEYGLTPSEVAGALHISAVSVRSYLGRVTEHFLKHQERIEKRLSRTTRRALPAYRTEANDE